LNDEKLEGKLAPAEKESVLIKIKEVEEWIRDHSNADAEEYEAQQKMLEKLFNPIASKLYQGGENGARNQN